MKPSSFDDRVMSLEREFPFEKVFTASSLVIVGTKEEDGQPNLAPKHMATPVGWSGFFGFACSPDHHTAQNIQRTGEFTVSYPRPDHIVSVSLSAEDRDEAGEKPDLAHLETVPAPSVDAPFLKDSFLYLECELREMIEDLGENNFILGNVVGKHVHQDVIRRQDRDDADLIHEYPILAYLHPGRYAAISESWAFPFPKDFDER